MSLPKSVCAHIDAIETVRKAERLECAKCVEIGSDWVHLRTCQSCGVTSCCDQSPHRHATNHFYASGHPVIASAQPGESWLYCYADEAFKEY